jgi:hypothetical protein
MQMAVRGLNDTLWTSTFNSTGTFMNDWVQIPGTILSGPALAWNPNYPGGARMQMVACGGGNSIWRATFNSGGTFMNDWAQIPGTILSAPALAWVSPTDKMLMVVRGGGDSIWFTLLNADGSQYGSWAQIPGTTLSAPALAWNPNYPGGARMQMAVRGLNDTIWTSTFDSTGTFMNDWVQIPGFIFEAPALTWNPNYPGGARMQMVVRGGGDSIWMGSFNSSGVFNNDWTQISGFTPSAPAIVNLPSGDVCIVVRGLNNAVWEMLF